MAMCCERPEHRIEAQSSAAPQSSPSRRVDSEGSPEAANLLAPERGAEGERGEGRGVAAAGDGAPQPLFHLPTPLLESDVGGGMVPYA